MAHALLGRGVAEGSPTLSNSGPQAGQQWYSREGDTPWALVDNATRPAEAYRTLTTTRPGGRELRFSVYAQHHSHATTAWPLPKGAPAVSLLRLPLACPTVTPYLVAGTPVRRTHISAEGQLAERAVFGSATARHTGLLGWLASALVCSPTLNRSRRAPQLALRGCRAAAPQSPILHSQHLILTLTRVVPRVRYRGTVRVDAEQRVESGRMAAPQLGSPASSDRSAGCWGVPRVQEEIPSLSALHQGCGATVSACQR